MEENHESQYNEALLNLAAISNRVKFKQRQLKALSRLIYEDPNIKADLEKCAKYFSSGLEDDQLYGDVLLEAIREKIDTLDG